MTLPTDLPTLTKGHGTGNDFLLFTDTEGTGELSPDVVAAITNRHTGIGADGLIRAVPTALVDPAALHYNQTQTFVYVVGPDNRLAVRPVELGARLGNLFIAKSGLKPGDRAVAAGNPLLRPGVPVRVLGEATR